ncbi:hypothetical protein GF386_03180, partial [Candidatus Pacearchaeota archaeon]|nr:hypothetical protein [Candidatus Pacearchaeota archaeon]MBD3283143.1 hypothetical protein [Candidatus Pacearchaeota archaeon]
MERTRLNRSISNLPNYLQRIKNKVLGERVYSDFPFYLRPKNKISKKNIKNYYPSPFVKIRKPQKPVWFFLSLILLLIFFIYFSYSEVKQKEALEKSSPFQKEPLFSSGFFKRIISPIITGRVIKTEREEVVEEYVLEKSNLKIKKSVSGNKNKVMDFKTSDGNLVLYFDLLNYSEFVENLNKEIKRDIQIENQNQNQKISHITGRVVDDKEDFGLKKKKLRKAKEKLKELNNYEIETITDDSVVQAEGFDVEIQKAEDEEYKWGYKVKLRDTKFMARIDITSDKNIEIYDNNTLRIGRSLLSFSDLIAEGYKIRIEKPSLELKIIENISDINVTNISEVNVTKINITEINITGDEAEVIEVNASEINETEGNETGINITEITEPEINLTDVNVSEEVVEVNLSEKIRGVEEVYENLSEDVVEEEIKEIK